MPLSKTKKILFIIIPGAAILLPIIVTLYFYASGFRVFINSLTHSLLNLISRPYYNKSDKTLLVGLYNFSLVFMILAGSLFCLRHLFLIRKIRKIEAAVNKFCQSEFGCPVSPGKKSELDRLVTLVSTMSKKLTEKYQKQLAILNKLKTENRFQSQVLQMVLSLQNNCFPQKDLRHIISNFLSMFFPEDSCTLFLQKDQEKLRLAAVWGVEWKEVTMSPYECLALWEGQVHWGSNCNGSFRCKFPDEISKKCICTPISDLGLLRVVSDADEPQFLTKKKWTLLVAEHLGVILRGFKMGEDLRNLALRDPLTGLFNRRFMEEALKLEITKAERENNIIGVIMIDLDHFKRFNDTYGHLVGDNLLKEIGLLFMNNCRSSDIVCRYGGEEFTLIMVDSNENNLVKRLEQLKHKIEGLRIWHTHYWLTSPTFSAGIAIYPHHGDNVDVLLKSADSALYKAKKLGRNRICMAGEDKCQEMVSNAYLSKQNDGMKNKTQLLNPLKG
jgi:diguanylate cyclase (GGDEF)-like protein